MLLIIIIMLLLAICTMFMYEECEKRLWEKMKSNIVIIQNVLNQHLTMDGVPISRSTYNYVCPWVSEWPSQTIVTFKFLYDIILYSYYKYVSKYFV